MLGQEESNRMYTGSVHKPFSWSLLSVNLIIIIIIIIIIIRSWAQDSSLFRWKRRMLYCDIVNKTVLNLLKSVKCRWPGLGPPSWTLVNSQFRSLHLKSLLAKKRSQLSSYIFLPHTLIEFWSQQRYEFDQMPIKLNYRSLS